MPALLDSKHKDCKLFNNCGGGCYAMAFVSKLEYDKRCIIHANKEKLVY